MVKKLRFHCGDSQGLFHYTVSLVTYQKAKMFPKNQTLNIWWDFPVPALLLAVATAAFPELAY